MPPPAAWPLIVCVWASPWRERKRSRSPPPRGLPRVHHCREPGRVQPDLPDHPGGGISVSAQIIGAGNLTKVLPGTLTLAGANSYTGRTFIGTSNGASGGIVVLTNDLS